QLRQVVTQLVQLPWIAHQPTSSVAGKSASRRSAYRPGRVHPPACLAGRWPGGGGRVHRRDAASVRPPGGRRQGSCLATVAGGAGSRRGGPGGVVRGRSAAVSATVPRAQPSRRLRPPDPPLAQPHAWQRYLGTPGWGSRVITVLLVDDHSVVRAGVRGMLAGEPDVTVVGEAASAAEAVVSVAALAPDVVLMDLRMPGGDGVAATRRILAGSPATRVVVLTTYETDGDILPAVEAGAAGYLLKDASRADLLHAVRAAARGETVLAPSVARRLVRRVRQPAVSLSGREVEVLRLVGAGLSNAEIG